MNMKRIVAMMALATVLSSGVTAHAAVGFNQNASTNTQEAESFLDTTQTPDGMPDQAEGKIEINGTFKKIITNFPEAEKDGRYLNVSMPIKMDFEYNADTKMLTSAQGTILNGSVHAENIQNGQGTITPQPIEMSFIGLDADATNANNDLIEFVNTVDTTNTDKVQVPLRMKLSNKGTVVNNYTLKDINENNTSPIAIGEGDNVQLEFELVPGQTVINEDLLTTDITTTKHSLNLRFEYIGK